MNSSAINATVMTTLLIITPLGTGAQEIPYGVSDKEKLGAILRDAQTHLATQQKARDSPSGLSLTRRIGRGLHPLPILIEGRGKPRPCRPGTAPTALKGGVSNRGQFYDEYQGIVNVLTAGQGNPHLAGSFLGTPDLKKILYFYGLAIFHCSNHRRVNQRESVIGMIPAVFCAALSIWMLERRIAFGLALMDSSVRHWVNMVQVKPASVFFFFTRNIFDAVSHGGAMAAVVEAVV